MLDLTPITRRRLHAVVAAISALIVAVLLVPTALMAIALGLGLAPLPYDLLLVLRQLPIVFATHMIASGLALILIPITAFARRHRQTHRVLGRLTAVSVVIGGLTALPVAAASEAVAAARAGLFTQGVVWLALISMAVAAIRRGDAARHATLMIAMAAVASGAVWLRLVMAVAVARHLPFETIYGVAAWACWVVPLALTQLRLANRTAVAWLAPGFPNVPSR
jgi:hypothetical protein